MSTIIRKREQQQQQVHVAAPLPVIEEENPSHEAAPAKSEVDAELREIARNIGDIFCSNGEEDFDLEIGDGGEAVALDAPLPKGAPINLLELLDKCHAMVPVLDYYPSGASSECGEVVSWPESPLKRRKKRKNKTGWPGNKLRKKIGGTKHTMEKDSERKKEGLEVERVRETSRVEEEEEEEDTEEETKENDKQTTLSAMEETTETSQVTVEESDVIEEDSKEREPVPVESDACTNNKKPNFIPKEEAQSQPESQIDELSLSQRIYSEFIIQQQEDTPVNDENHHKNVDSNRQIVGKGVRRKRPRTSTSCDDAATESYLESENHDGAKRQNSSESRGRSENSRKRSFGGRRNRQRPKKRQRRRVSSAEIDFEVENDCKKDSSYCAINSITNLNSSSRKGVRKSRDNDALDAELKERVTPTVLTPTELVQKRSSIEFQPVVRVMKIDERVDIEHSIRSVTVASNRRLRSSSSPKSNSNAQLNKRRHKNGRGQIRRWMKNS